MLGIKVKPRVKLHTAFFKFSEVKQDLRGNKSDFMIIPMGLKTYWAQKRMNESNSNFYVSNQIKLKKLQPKDF